MGGGPSSPPGFCGGPRGGPVVMRIDARVAAITGASSGIGAELARQLARLGVRVGLTARRVEDLEALAGSIRSEGGTASVAQADALDPAGTRAALGRIAADLGPIDLLVANAGVGLGTPGAAFSGEVFARMVGVNLLGPAHAIEAVLPSMIERGRGQVVGISSLAGYRGLPGSSGYSATKAGLTALLEGLRPELARLGVAVTVVHPGYVRTPMTAGQANRQPFLMDCEPAVGRIVRGIARKSRRVDFPGPMVGLLRVARALPGWMFDPVAARILLGPRRRQ